MVNGWLGDGDMIGSADEDASFLENCRSTGLPKPAPVCCILNSDIV